MPRPEGKERGFEGVSAPENLENQAERKNALVPWEPLLLQGGEERQPRVLPVRLGTRGGPPSQPRGLLPRTEEVALLIGTAVCGKPHVRWCERADELDNHRSTRLCSSAPRSGSPRSSYVARHRFE